MDDNTSWISCEFQNINLHDKRLNTRFIKVAKSMMESPGSNIHHATGGWAAAKGAYRLFDNPSLTRSNILEPHYDNTIARAKEVPENDILLSIQDSTTLSYTQHKKTAGLKKLSKQAGFETEVKGFHLHNNLLITESGLPLGLLSQKLFCNDAPREPHKNRPIQEKKSYRWLQGLAATHNTNLPHKIITVCDRESDIFEFFIEARNLKQYFLVRSNMDRRLTSEGCKLRESISNEAACGEIEIKITGNSTRKSRIARLKVSFKKVILTPPQRLPGAKVEKLEPVEIYIIQAREVNSKCGSKPLKWLLLTNNKVDSFKQAAKCCQWYSLRWNVEEYHKIMKSGCNIEECQLQSIERLERYTALISVIAFRLFWLTLINRVIPHESCCAILKDYEWKALYCAVQKTKQIPGFPPTVRESMRMLGKLGGFWGRKSDGEPGITVIWRGWRKLQDLVELWLVMEYKHENICG